MRARVAAAIAVALVLAIVAWRLAFRQTPSGKVAADAKADSPSARASNPPPIRLSGGRVDHDEAAPFTFEARVVSTATGAGVASAVVGFSDGGTVEESTADESGHLRWTTRTYGRYEVASITAPAFLPFQPAYGESALAFTAAPAVQLRGVTLFLTPLRVGQDRDGGAATEDATDHAKGRADLAGPSGRLVGTVRSSSGEPLTAFTIVAAVRRGGVERGARRSSAFLDATGSYALSVPIGTHCVSAYAMGRAGAAEQCVEVKLDADTRADFTLSAGSRIRGRVTDRATRAPIAGARISMENPNAVDDSPLPVIASAESRADGSFELAGADTGVRSLFITADGHHSRVVPGLQLESDREAPALEIDLQATDPGEPPSIESAGLNCAVAAQGDALVINALTPEGGAAQAGLKLGDAILAVDGTLVASLGMQAGVERLRGPEGSTVTVTIRRPPDDKPFDVVVTRRRVVNR